MYNIEAIYNMESLPGDVIRLIFNQADDATYMIGRYMCRRFRQCLPYHQTGLSSFAHSLPLTQWAMSHGIIHIYPSAIRRAAKAGNQEVLQIFLDKGHPPDNDAFEEAIAGGHLSLVQWMYSINPNISRLVIDVCDLAIRFGHFDILKWLHQHNYTWSDLGLPWSATGGHLEMVKWLIDNGAQCDWKTMFKAVKHGRITIMEYLYQLGHRGDERMCRIAAQNNQLESLKWLRLKGFPWDSTVIHQARLNNNINIVKWAIDHGCPHTPN